MTRKFINQVVALAFLTAIGSNAVAQNSTNYKVFSPGDQTEFGVALGYSALIGDLNPKPGFGGALSIRKALDHTFSLRVEAGAQLINGETPSLTGFPYGGSETRNLFLNDPREYNKYNSLVGSGSVHVLISLNNGRWEGGARKINPYVFLGAGGSYVKTELEVINILPGAPSTFVKGKQELVIPGTRNTGAVVPHFDGGLGLGYRINNKVSIGIEEKLTTVFGKRADLLDGFQYNFRDFLSFTSLRLGFNFGGGKDSKKTLPLWWVGPADQVNADIAELKARPKFDTADADGDGVIDMLDQEKDSPSGARVDTRGVALDSDGDGLPDYKDKEAFSPVGYKVDGNGVAQVPKPAYVTEADVDRIVDGKIRKLEAQMANMPTSTTVKGSSMSDWFLPMIHFDLDKSNIKASEYGDLAAVATVLKNNPGLNVVVTGHTDRLSSDSYNQGLSYRRAQASIDALVKRFGVDRSRLVLNYGGEETNLVPTKSESYMNRRVEFKVAQGESEMSAPSGMKKKNYKGNKSGY
jgi:OmpA-OmpF porin, OOP family